MQAAEKTLRWPIPHPQPTGIPSPQGHRPSLGSCPHPLAPALQAKLGGSEMSLLARGWPSLTLEQNVGPGSRKEAWGPRPLAPWDGLA